MSIITIGTPFNIDLEFRIAPFGKRLAAWLVDIVIITLYFYLMIIFVKPLFYKGSATAVGTEIFIIILPVMLYQLVFELFSNGQTIGKKALGIKVIDKSGQEPTLGQYIIRWMLCIGNLFIYLIPYALISSPALLIAFIFIYLPDFLSVMISAKSQRISDFAAGTVVIDKNYRSNISETIYLNIEQKDYQPIFPQVMRLNDRDINGIRNLINEKRGSKDTDNYMYQVVDKIKSVLAIQTELDGYPFLEQLLKDYNYFTSKK